MMLKVAILIMAHKNADQIIGLVEEINRESAILAIHIDKRTSFGVYDRVASELKHRRNVLFVERLPVIYPGWSQCRVVFAALSRLCHDDLKWNYFINLSGQDYPIKPIDSLYEWLGRHRGSNFIDVRAIDKLNPRLRGIVRRRYQWLAIEFPDRVRRFPIPLSPFNHFQVYYYGSAWYMITREFCDWIVGSDAETRIARRFRHTYIPDEFVMQDLIMASPYSDTLVCDNRRYCIFNGQHPSVLTMDDFDAVMRSEAFFARKFDPHVDDVIIDKISQAIS